MNVGIYQIYVSFYFVISLLVQGHEHLIQLEYP